MSASTPTLASSGLFKFQKDATFLDNQAGASIELDAAKSPAVGLALAGNTPFPAGTVRLGSVSARVHGGTGDVKFGGGSKGTVSFSGSGGVRAGLGVYALA